MCCSVQMGPPGKPIKSTLQPCSAKMGVIEAQAWPDRGAGYGTWAAPHLENVCQAILGLLPEQGEVLAQCKIPPPVQSNVAGNITEI